MLCYYPNQGGVDLAVRMWSLGQWRANPIVKRTKGGQFFDFRCFRKGVVYVPLPTVASLRARTVRDFGKFCD